MRWCMAFALMGGLACGGDETASTIEPPVDACAEGEWLRDDGRCAAPGLPTDMPCPPGEWLRDDGACIPAGVPPDGCAQGFIHDGDRGCEPILPASPCGDGLIAVPGDETCGEVAPCATGTWGDIPVEPDTEYVDTSYAGTDSDGTALKPWTSVQAGIAAASSGAIVAIAAGTYVEDVVVSGMPVRLWGVCPALVEIVGTGAELATVQTLSGASGTEIRNLAIAGVGMGFAPSGSRDVLLERVWVHDTGHRGIDVEPALGPTSITVRRSLVERARVTGVFVYGAQATFEASVIRSTQPNAQGAGGRGMSFQARESTGAPATVSMRQCVVENNQGLGVYVSGSEATLDASIIRDTQPTAQASGRALSAQAEEATGAPATLVVRSSLLERNHDVGVFVAGSQATIEGTVIRHTQPDARGLRGLGLEVQAYPTTGVQSTLTLRTSLVADNHAVGVFVAGSEATVEATVLRDTEPTLDGREAAAVHAQLGIDGMPSMLLLRASLIERSHGVGVLVTASDATIENNIVRDTLPDPQGFYGRGVNVQGHPTAGTPSTAVVRASLIEQSHEAGVAIFSSLASVDACVVRDTTASPAHGAGEGVMVFAAPGAATATITSTRVEQSELAAVAAWGANVAIGGSAFRCQAFDFNRETLGGNAGGLEDLGGNRCGCPEPAGACKSVSAGLAPPPPVEEPR